MLSYLFLLLVITFTVFVLNDIKKQLNKSCSLAVIILLFLNVMIFIMMDLFTLEIRKGVAISGNGNPGILILIFMVPFLISFLWVWASVIYKGFVFKPLSVINKYLLYGLSFLTLGIIFEAIFFNQKLSKLKGFPYHPFNGEYDSMLNIYTNDMYFNGNTFGIVVFLVFIVTLLWSKKGSSNQSNKNKAM